MAHLVIDPAFIVLFKRFHLDICRRSQKYNACAFGRPLEELFGNRNLDPNFYHTVASMVQLNRVRYGFESFDPWWVPICRIVHTTYSEWLLFCLLEIAPESCILTPGLAFPATTWDLVFDSQWMLAPRSLRHNRSIVSKFVQANPFCLCYLSQTLLEDDSVTAIAFGLSSYRFRNFFNGLLALSLEKRQLFFRLGRKLQRTVREVLDTHDIFHKIFLPGTKQCLLFRQDEATTAAFQTKLACFLGISLSDSDLQLFRQVETNLDKMHPFLIEEDTTRPLIPAAPYLRRRRRVPLVGRGFVERNSAGRRLNFDDL